jgi:hypothetical protein
MIGSSLVLTVLGTFVMMAIWGINLERMSLGALIVVLGEIVDNSIVVAEGTAMRLKKGMERRQAVIEGAAQSAWPLLGATVVAIMAFYPIFASTSGAGEYCRTLFIVVAISLILSWLLAMTLTPLQCFDMLPTPKEGGTADDPYGGGLYRLYRAFLESAVRYRWFTIASMVGLLIVAVFAFGKVEQLFFPDASMAKFMIDYWAPEGTRIQQVSSDLKRLEQKLLSDKRVESVNTFIGGGPPRFYLPVSPEAPNPSYAQLVVNMHSFRDVDALIADLNPWVTENVREALVPVRKYGVGPSHTWRFEACPLSELCGRDSHDFKARVPPRGSRCRCDSNLFNTGTFECRRRFNALLPEDERKNGEREDETHTSMFVTLIAFRSYTPSPSFDAYSMCPGSRMMMLTSGCRSLALTLSILRYFGDRSQIEIAPSAFLLSSIMSSSSRSIATGSVPIMICLGEKTYRLVGAKGPPCHTARNPSMI